MHIVYTAYSIVVWCVVLLTIFGVLPRGPWVAVLLGTVLPNEVRKVVEEWKKGGFWSAFLVLGSLVASLFLILRMLGVL